MLFEKPVTYSLSGWTSILIAARYGQNYIVQTLIDHKADINAENNEGLFNINFLL